MCEIKLGEASFHKWSEFPKIEYGFLLYLVTFAYSVQRNVHLGF